MLGTMAVGYRIVTVMGLFVFLIHTNPVTSIGDYAGGIDPALSHGLPTYIHEPENNYYIVKHKPVTLVCAAHGAAQIIFRCAGQWVREKRHVNLELLDTVTGIKYMQTSIDVIRDEVEEYYGLDGYWCECHAWGKVGEKSDAKISKRGVVQVAYLRKRFQREPISTRVEIHTTVQLQCLPPDGLPAPKVFWIKNGKPLNVKNDINYIISNEGNLIINQARLSDMGNYTCGAQNAASRRLSESATLTVYVNGGWSTWSQWTECSAKCGKGLQRRMRTCSNPEPRNEGAPCSGESSQRNPCTSICPKDGGWSSWSSWSTCSPDCVHYRRRDCDSPQPGSGGQYCHGTDLATSNCTGGMCRGFYNPYNGNPKAVRNGNQYHQVNQADLDVNPNLARKSQSSASKKDDSDNIALYVGLSVAFAVFITIGIIIIYLVRRRHYQQPGVYDMDIPSSDLNTPTMDDDEKKVNKNGQDMMSIQPDLMQTVVQLRSPMSDMSNSPNNNHLDSSDKFHIYAEPNENRLSGSYGKNSGTYKILDVDPNNVMSHSLKSNVDKLTMKDKAALQISTPSDHRPLLGGDTDTVSSQQFYMAAQLPQNIDIEAIAWNTFDYKGGRLVIAEAGVSLTVPEGAIPKGHREQLYMAVCRDDKDRPRLSDTQTILSPIIQCGSQSQLLKKPVILSFPHCASMRQGGWMLTVCSSDVRVDEPPQWRVAVVLGQETLNTPLYTQLDPHHCHLMTESLVRYTLIGESAPGGRAVKILRLAAFAPTTPVSMDFSIRVYVVEDTQDALEGVFQIERNLGGRLLDKPKQILFQDGGNNLCLTIEEMSHGWRSKLAASYQEIPFWHIWSGNQNNLHCSFSLELVDRNEQSLSCLIQVYQKAILSNRQVLHINTNIKESALSLSSQSTLQRQKPVAVSTNASTGFGTVAMLEPTTLGFRISSGARNHLCLLLDPPNARGNDWRMLAQALTVDRYINYFASKPSPTEHILDLWEARHREESALTDLMNILRVMGRMDASAVLEKDLGPWL